MTLWKDKAEFHTDPGDTKAHIQAFISSLGQLGHVNTKQEWDPLVPTYARFSLNNDNTDVIYNPSDSSISVTFSNGKTIEIPPQSIATDKFAPMDVIPYTKP